MSSIKFLVVCCHYNAACKDSYAVPRESDDNRAISSHVSVLEALRECHKMNDCFEKINESDTRCCYVAVDDGHYDPEPDDEQAVVVTDATEPEAAAVEVNIRGAAMLVAQ